MTRDRRSSVPMVLALFLCLNTGGCGGSSKNYAPTAEGAKETLDRALSAWQKGEKSNSLETASPPINVSIADWQAGKVLEKFEILKEEPVPGEVNKMFSTNLRLKGAKSDTKARFIVIGREPIWVYGENDFKNLLNMDNNKPATKTKGR